MKIISRIASAAGYCELGACRNKAAVEIAADELSEERIFICEDCLGKLRSEIARYFAKCENPICEKEREKMADNSAMIKKIVKNTEDKIADSAAIMKKCSGFKTKNVAKNKNAAQNKNIKTK